MQTLIQFFFISDNFISSSFSFSSSSFIVLAIAARRCELDFAMKVRLPVASAFSANWFADFVKASMSAQKMSPFLGFLDYKENVRLNNTLFCQLARLTVYLSRAIGQPRISTPVISRFIFQLNSLADIWEFGLEHYILLQQLHKWMYIIMYFLIVLEKEFLYCFLFNVKKTI